MDFLKKTIFISVIVVVVGVYGQENIKPIEVNAEQLYEIIRKNEATIIDVREPWELKQEGKIARSVNIPMKILKESLSLSPEEFKRHFGKELPAKDNCNLIFHCKSGGRSLKAVTLARDMGWKCSRHLLGGFTAWKEYFY